MRTSESINELAAALAKAQGELKPAPKDSVNPHFRSKFADLASCMTTALPVLARHGLSLIQAPTFSDGAMTLVTRLAHSSGQWVEASWPLPVAKPQEMGSAMTYGRRYSLALFGLVTDEDDDAEAASGRGAVQSVKVSPHPAGSDSCDPELVEQYADGIRTHLNVGDVDGIMGLHRELNANPPLYSAVGQKLNTKEKAALREMVAKGKAA